MLGKVQLLLLILILTPLKINCTDNDDDEEEDIGFFERYIHKTMDLYSKNSFKTFPDPIKMNDMAFKADMGIFGTAEGVCRNMTLYGFSKLKHTISNVDFISNHMDLVSEFPYHNIEGIAFIKGYWLGIFQYTVKADQKLKVYGLRHESVQGVGRITIESIDMELLPELPGTAIYILIFFGIYWLVVISFTCLFICNRLSNVNKTSASDGDMGMETNHDIPEIMTSGDEQFEIFKVSSKLEEENEAKMLQDAGTEENDVIESPFPSKTQY